MCEAIVDAAVREARGRRVRGVRVRVGGHAVDPGVVEQGFRMAAAGTVAQDAALDLVMEPPTARCGGCGAESPVTDAARLVACPRCGGVDVEVAGHDDVVVESITLDGAGRGGS